MATDDEVPPLRPGVPPAKRPGMVVFICRRGGRPAPPPRRTGAGVRFVTCHCGGQFMAVQGRMATCPRCGARSEG